MMSRDLMIMHLMLMHLMLMHLMLFKYFVWGNQLINGVTFVLGAHLKIFYMKRNMLKDLESGALNKLQML